MAQIRTYPGTDVATLVGLEDVFDNIISVILALGGLALFVMLVLGGLNYITAGADPKKAEAAKKTLTAAILGIVLVALAFLFLQIIQNFTGAPVTEFTIRQEP